MTKLEKISLFFGFVTLLADLASLLTFATGLLSFEEVVPVSVDFNSALLLYKSLTFLFLAYGWLVFSWYLTRRSLNLKRGKRSSLSTRSSKAVSGMGLLLVPIAIVWIIFVSRTVSNLESQQISASMDTPVPTIAITQTAVSTEMAADTSVSKTPTPTQPAGDISDMSLMVGLTLGLPLGMPLLGFAIWGSINLLMPLINVELLDD